MQSLKEAFPMVILEAMACEVSIVATRVGGIPLIVENKEHPVRLKDLGSNEPESGVFEDVARG